MKNTELQNCSIIITLIGLRGHEVLYEGVRGLRVEGESVLEADELLGLVDVRHLQPVAACVEVLLHHVQGAFQHGALLRRQALFALL